MRAAVCRAFGQPLTIEEVDLDPPRSDEVKVRVAACAVCHSDISYIDGAWGGSLPAVYGHEAAGVVEEVGSAVESLTKGAHVVITLVRACGTCYLCLRGQPALCETTALSESTSPLRDMRGETVRQGLCVGGFSEHVVVHASQVVPLPLACPLDIASLLACGVLTGFGAVVNATRVQAGNSVVVVGAGAVGLSSVQAAELSGAWPIIAVDTAGAKLEVAARLGATHTIDASQDDQHEIVRALTGGRGADHVFVAVGDATAVEQGLALVRRGGELIVLGMPRSGAVARFDPGELAHDGVRIVGCKLGSARPHADVPWLVQLYLRGRLRLEELISRRYPFDAIEEALASARGGQAIRNVLVFPTR